MLSQTVAIYKGSGEAMNFRLVDKNKQFSGPNKGILPLGASRPKG